MDQTFLTRELKEKGGALHSENHLLHKIFLFNFLIVHSVQHMGS